MLAITTSAFQIYRTAFQLLGTVFLPIFIRGCSMAPGLHGTTLSFKPDDTRLEILD
jgi:hypothetical protein